MKHHLHACYLRALREGLTNFAAAIAALYEREFGKPMPGLKPQPTKEQK